jgi:hypothetical protein
MSTLVKDAIADFRRSVEITRDVRFQANLRLASRQRSSSYIVSLLSLYVIGLSLIPNIFALQQYQSQILLACSIILSAFVIFTSLIDGSQNFYHQGELLHQCARRIAAINHRLKNIDTDKDATEALSQLEKMQEEYQRALDECPINHDNVDYFNEVIRKPFLFPNYYPWECKWVHRSMYRVRAFIMGNRWWFIHAIVALLITYIVARFILAGAIPVTVHGAN